MPSCTRRKYQVGESTEPHQAKNGLVRVDFNPQMLTGVKGFQQRLNLCHHSDKGLVMKAWRIAFIANLTDLTFPHSARGWGWRTWKHALYRTLRQAVGDLILVSGLDSLSQLSLACDQIRPIIPLIVDQSSTAVHQLSKSWWKWVCVQWIGDLYVDYTGR